MRLTASEMFWGQDDGGAPSRVSVSPAPKSPDTTSISTNKVVTYSPIIGAKNLWHRLHLAVVRCKSPVE